MFRNLITLTIFLFSSMAFALQGAKLSDTIPYPFYEVQRAADGQDNDFTILNSGIASFEKRIQMIQEAKKTIEVEYFIFNDDLSGRLVMQELALAGKRGVKVRMLIDMSKAVLQLSKYVADLVSDYNIDLRFYNSAPLISLSNIQFRNHRKLIIVDDEQVVLGGRNIGDEYFDLDKKYNFYDRDVHIKGSIVETMRKSFDIFFEDKITLKPKLPREKVNRRIEKAERKALRKAMSPLKLEKKLKRIKKKYTKKMNEVMHFVKRSQEDQEQMDKIRAVGKRVLDQVPTQSCPEVTWSTDRPGGNFKTRLKHKYSHKFRYLRKTFYDKMVNVDQELIISSPYLLHNRASRKMMGHLADNGVKITAYTNSLSSTDAIYVAALLYKDVKRWDKMGFTINAHRGVYIPETETINEDIKKARWGTHSKTYLMKSSDANEFSISTYNVDNRSSYYNTELAIFCKGNDDLFDEVESNIQSRIEHGMKIQTNKKAFDNKTGEEVNRFGIASSNVTLMKLITLPSWLLQFLL